VRGRARDQGAVSGTAAVVSGRQPVNVREGLAGRTLTIRARTDAVMACRALPSGLVRACPVVPLAGSCGDKSGKHAGVPHGRPSHEQR
jgi:hypothetical protein